MYMPNLMAFVQYSKLPMGSNQYQMMPSTFPTTPTTMFTPLELLEISTPKML